MSLEYDVVIDEGDGLEPKALMKSAAAWACWMPVPLMRKTFLRLPLSRSAELAAGMSIGMLAFSKIVRVGSVAPEQ